MGCGSSTTARYDTDKGHLVNCPKKFTNPTQENEFFAEKLRGYLSQTYQRDKRCPLNERQLYGITKTWRAIRVNFTEVAINMFMRMFEENQDVQYYFCKFTKLETSADLRNSKALQAHAVQVMETLDDAISNLDDIDYFINMLTSIASTHVNKFDSNNLQIFWVIREPFLLAIKESLGDRFSMSIEATYRICIGFIIDIMVTGLLDARKAKGLPVPTDLKDFSGYLTDDIRMNRGSKQ